jgi:hypothetical protein
MIADPITLNTTTTNGIAATALADGDTQSALVFSTTETNAGRTKRTVSSSLLAALSLAKAELTISHTPTKGGRIRSVARVDVSQRDENGDLHTGSAYFVLDKEQDVSNEGIAMSQLAVRAVMAFFLEDSLPASVDFSTRAVAFYDSQP